MFNFFFEMPSYIQIITSILTLGAFVSLLKRIGAKRKFDYFDETLYGFLLVVFIIAGVLFLALGYNHVIKTCPSCGEHAPSDYCANCGFEMHPVCPMCCNDIDRDDSFCEKCGYSFIAEENVKVICVNCNKELELEDNFCGDCGTMVERKEK